MIVDEAVYLEHFGVKGMRWGVRRTNNTVRQEQASRARGSALRKGAVAGVIAGSVGLGLGVALKRMGDVSGSQVGGQRIKDGSFIVKNILKQIKDKKMSDLPNMTELKYQHGYQITKVVENILDMTR